MFRVSKNKKIDKILKIDYFPYWARPEVNAILDYCSSLFYDMQYYIGKDEKIVLKSNLTF